MLDNTDTETMSAFRCHFIDFLNVSASHDASGHAISRPKNLELYLEQGKLGRREQGNTAIWKQGNKGTRKRGNRGTREQGNKGTRGQGNGEQGNKGTEEQGNKGRGYADERTDVRSRDY